MTAGHAAARGVSATPAPGPVRRVLMSTDTVGGVWAFSTDLARALTQRGVRVELATMGAPLSDEQWEDAESIEGLSVHESTFALEWMKDPWGGVELAGEWLTWLEQRLAPDVVHLNGYAHAVLPWAGPVVVVAHSCVSSWWEAVHGEPPPARYGRYRESVAAGIACADAVVAPTEAMMATVRRLHGTPAVARVIHNGIWGTRGLRKGDKEPFVLAAGRAWDEGKNLRMLEGLAARLGHRVCVAGAQAWDAPTPPRGVQRVGTLGRRALRGLMAKAAIFAHPARYEPFGLAPLEAADAGCALVLADLPSLREVWQDAAVYVSADDEGAWLTVLGELLSDLPQLRRLSRRAWRRAQRFRASDMGERYLALYGELVGRNVKVMPEGSSA
jgi:glycogen synthase